MPKKKPATARGIDPRVDYAMVNQASIRGLTFLVFGLIHRLDADGAGRAVDILNELLKSDEVGFAWDPFTRELIEPPDDYDPVFLEPIVDGEPKMPYSRRLTRQAALDSRSQAAELLRTLTRQTGKRH